MKKQLLLCCMSLALLAGCSSGDDLLAEQPVAPAATIDDENITRQDLMGAFPIEYGGVSIGGEATVEEDGLTRGSASAENFRADSIGVFCLSSAKIMDAVSNDAVLHSWSGGVGTKLNFLNLWQDNALGYIDNVSANSGKIHLTDADAPRYYPGVDWFKYSFVAYQPYTKAILHSKSVLYAYMIVDGDDDVMCTMADTPHTDYNAETDAFAYSNEYFRRLTAAGVSITDDYKPYFTFKHLMASLKFHVKLKDTSSSPAHELVGSDQDNPGIAAAPRRAGSDPVFHVDSICFSGFMNVIRLQLAKLDGGVISSGALTYGYNPASLSEDIREALGTTQEGTKGHFWLREADGSSIRDKKVGGAFKYSLNSTDFTEVGDCIMIPPVTENVGSATILLQVFLSDEEGNRSQAFVTLNRPASGWESGKQYNIKLQITPPTNYIGQARAEVVDWDSSTDIEISD